MKIPKTIIIGIAAFAIAACAALQGVVPFLPTPMQGDCIITDVEKGMPALDIALDCKLEENAIAFIESLIAAKKQQARRLAASHDAGADQ